MATFNLRYSCNRRLITSGAEIAQILRKAATRIEGMKFYGPSVDHAEDLEDEGFRGGLGLRGLLDPKSSD